MSRWTAWVVGFATIALAGSATAAGLELSPSSDTRVVADALARAAGDRIRDAAAFPEQAFRVTEDGSPVGTIVPGRGSARTPDGRENATCFVALVAAGGQVTVLRTVGTGYWEA